ncbi:MAG: hypothetical protein LBB34_00015 [Holosporales bacterium]|jgi:hypothetical protein|nr:hypothetical protein [Holosporales bacterium]
MAELRGLIPDDTTDEAQALNGRLDFLDTEIARLGATIEARHQELAAIARSAPPVVRTKYPPASSTDTATTNQRLKGLEEKVNRTIVEIEKSKGGDIKLSKMDGLGAQIVDLDAQLNELEHGVTADGPDIEGLRKLGSVKETMQILRKKYAKLRDKQQLNSTTTYRASGGGSHGSSGPYGFGGSSYDAGSHGGSHPYGLGDNSYDTGSHGSSHPYGYGGGSYDAGSHASSSPYGFGGDAHSGRGSSPYPGTNTLHEGITSDEMNNPRLAELERDLIEEWDIRARELRADIGKAIDHIAGPKFSDIDGFIQRATKLLDEMTRCERGIYQQLREFKIEQMRTLITDLTNIRNRM